MGKVFQHVPGGQCKHTLQSKGPLLKRLATPQSTCWHSINSGIIQASPHCKPRLIGIFGQCCRFLRLKNCSLRTQFAINSHSGSSLQGLPMQMEMLKPKSRVLKLAFTTVGSTSCYLRSSAVSDMFSLFSLFHFLINADLNPKWSFRIPASLA